MQQKQKKANEGGKASPKSKWNTTRSIPLAVSRTSHVRRSSWYLREWICHFHPDSRILDPAFFPMANDICLLDLLIFKWWKSKSQRVGAYLTTLVLHAKEQTWCKRWNWTILDSKHPLDSCVFLYKSVPWWSPIKYVFLVDVLVSYLMVIRCFKLIYIVIQYM